MSVVIKTATEDRARLMRKLYPDAEIYILWRPSPPRLDFPARYSRLWTAERLQDLNGAFLRGVWAALLLDLCFTLIRDFWL